MPKRSVTSPWHWTIWPRLRDRSLVVAETVGSEIRFRLLEVAPGVRTPRYWRISDREWLPRRHADHFLALAEYASTKLQGPEQNVWIARLKQEQDNIHAALTLFRETPGSAIAGLRMTGALWRYWFMQSQFKEGKSICWPPLPTTMVLRRPQSAPLRSTAPGY